MPMTRYHGEEACELCEGTGAAYVADPRGGFKPILKDPCPNCAGTGAKMAPNEASLLASMPSEGDTDYDCGPH